MARSHSSSSTSASRQLSLDAINAESSRLRSQIASEIDEADDPLALYDRFVKWIFDEYPREHLTSSGLVEQLEEATRRYKDDSSYKSDLRYLKLWALYASLVDRPSVVYKFILANGIGTVYALLFEDYALTLERDGRHSAASEVYRVGIQRKARPVERLKKKYDEFRRRTSSKPPIPPPAPQVTLPKAKGTPEAESLRRQPLKNYDNSRAIKQAQPSSAPSQAPSTSSSSTSYSHNRYSYMLSPPAAGRRPEKLRLNLKLLFTEEGGEHSMSEARARSMGLLGKRWGPPPASELTRANSSTMRVNFNDDGTKNTCNYTAQRSLVVGEPTVTINTKAALADVFGMYNSPEKSTRLPGTKHAPVHAVERVAPLNLQAQTRPASVENASHPMAPPSFKPFIDENAGRNENTPKFKPFVDENLQARPPATASMSARRALASKDIGTAVLTLKTKGTDDSDKPNVFSKVFTPVDKEEIGHPAEYSLQPESQSSRTTGQNAALKPGTQRRTLLGDAQIPFKVFSRPPEKDSVFSRPDSFATSDEDASNVAPPPDSSNRASLGMFIPHRQEERPEVLSSEDEEYQEDIPPNAATGHEDDTEEFEVTHETPFGGRFGQFNVMTPITERTLEYTSTGRLFAPGDDTPATVELGERAFREPDAVEAAERLAAEVREDSVFSGKPRATQLGRNPRGDEESSSSSSSFQESLFSRPPPFRLSEGHTIIIPSKAADEDFELRAVTALVEEKTGTLNLSDGIFTAPGFDLPNPCNPFDPPIISTLLSHLPTDPHYYHVPQESQLLENLQKFSRKQMRKSRSLARDQTFSLQLEDLHFQVSDKLGEGGFGAVFAAKAVAAKAEDNDDEDDDDEDEDEESGRVAIKVVKPSNSWEFQMLRKVHASLPAPLRSSVIHPHAQYTFHDESFLILDLCAQGSLLDIINRASSAGISQQGTCLDELLVVFFTIELLRLLEGLHKAGFIHGDLKIDNCLVRLEDVSPSAWAAQYDPTGAGGWQRKGIKLIDFGRTIDIRMFPRGQTFIADWTTDARDCVEMREGRPWTYQADYFGLAGIVYCMLYGKYIEASSIVRVAPSSQQEQGNDRSRYKLATAFKRYWQTDLWTRLFDVLLNPCLVNPDGALPVSDTLVRLRTEMETWLQANCSRSSNTLKGLLKKIELSVIRGD